MGLNDEQERLDQAEEYLISYAWHSQEFQAALEHVRWVHKNKPEYQPRCARIMITVAAEAKRRSEPAKLRELGLDG